MILLVLSNAITTKREVRVWGPLSKLDDNTHTHTHTHNFIAAKF